MRDFARKLKPELRLAHEPSTVVAAPVDSVAVQLLDAACKTAHVEPHTVRIGTLGPHAAKQAHAASELLANAERDANDEEGCAFHSCTCARTDRASHAHATMR